MVIKSLNKSFKIVPISDHAKTRFLFLRERNLFVDFLSIWIDLSADQSFHSLFYNILRYVTKILRILTILVVFENRQKNERRKKDTPENNMQKDENNPSNNPNENNPLFSLICIRFSTCKVGRLKRALVLS